MPLDKYNKGLPLMATLFNICPDVFVSDSFIDMYTSCSLFATKKDYLFLLYKSVRDTFITSTLRNNKYYYNDIRVIVNGEVRYLFIFKADKVIESKYSYMVRTGSLFIIKPFLLTMCYFWKDYMSDITKYNEFLDCWSFASHLETEKPGI